MTWLGCCVQGWKLLAFSLPGTITVLYEKPVSRGNWKARRHLRLVTVLYVVQSNLIERALVSPRLSRLRSYSARCSL